MTLLRNRIIIYLSDFGEFCFKEYWMNPERKYITQYNLLMKRFNGIYHNAAVQAGISDSTFQILYLLCDSEETVKQSDIVSAASLAPQTVNSSLKKMEKEGLVELRRIDGKMGKSICLTKKGAALTEKIISPIMRAEEKACSTFSDDDKETFFQLFHSVIRKIEAEITGRPVHPASK